MKRQRHRLLLLVLALMLAGPVPGRGNDQIPDVIHQAPLWVSADSGAAAGTAVEGDAAAEGMPLLLWIDRPGRTGYEVPRWVSVRAAFDAEGELVPEHFHPYTLQNLQELLRKPPQDGCIRQEEIYYDLVNPPDWSTFPRLVTSSGLLVRGEVTGKDFGFKGSVPGQLVRFVPNEYLKGGPEPVSEYFVFYPVGTFRAGGEVVCKTDRRAADVPDLGDDVIVAMQDRDDPAEPFLETDLFGPHGVITLHANGVPSLPEQLRDRPDAPVGVADLLSTLRAVAAEEVE